MTTPAPNKALGQHFLHDRNILATILRAAGDLTHTNVIEIGPGPGALTRALLEAGVAQLLVVEKDHRFLPGLEALGSAFPGRLQIVQGDALKLSLTELCGRLVQPPLPIPPPLKRERDREGDDTQHPAHSAHPSLQIIANLPYNISSPLLYQWLPELAPVSQLLLMFQKEVVDRITALPHTKDYGKLSVLTQTLCDADTLCLVPPGCFTPPPKVMSAVVRLVPKSAFSVQRSEFGNAALYHALSRVTSAGFEQRRKMLRGSLKTLGIPPETLLAPCGIDSTLRAENLTVAQFQRLARAFLQASSESNAATHP
jgi:16S rRNA (adenine1518-N6/adenine1519-N6)-dimethyltransferase